MAHRVLLVRGASGQMQQASKKATNGRLWQAAGGRLWQAAMFA